MENNQQCECWACLGKWTWGIYRQKPCSCGRDVGSPPGVGVDSPATFTTLEEGAKSQVGGRLWFRFSRALPVWKLGQQVVQGWWDLRV